MEPDAINRLQHILNTIISWKPNSNQEWEDVKNHIIAIKDTLVEYAKKESETGD